MLTRTFPPVSAVVVEDPLGLLWALVPWLAVLLVGGTLVARRIRRAHRVRLAQAEAVREHVRASTVLLSRIRRRLEQGVRPDGSDGCRGLVLVALSVVSETRTLVRDFRLPRDETLVEFDTEVGRLDEAVHGLGGSS